MLARTTTAKIAVIIPHLNQPERLVNCLESLHRQSLARGDFEIIIVDNGSAQPIAHLLKDWPDVQLLYEPSPGAGLARNRGVAAARAPLLAFIDADCRAHPDWLATILATISGPDAPDIIGGDVRIDCLDPTHPTPLEAYEQVFAYRQKLYIEHKGFSGAGNMATRRAIFDKVGPFAGLAVSEDRDWGRRATAMGLKITYVPPMIVYHPARTSVAEYQQKLARQAAHDWHDVMGHRLSSLRWIALAVLVAGSIPVHAFKALLSPRLPSWKARGKAMLMLARLRSLRCILMARMLLDPAARIGALRWNRPD